MSLKVGDKVLVRDRRYPNVHVGILRGFIERKNDRALIEVLEGECERHKGTGRTIVDHEGVLVNYQKKNLYWYVDRNSLISLGEADV